MKSTLLVLSAQHQRESGRVAEALAGIDALYIKKLAALFEELLSRSDSPGDALATLTKIIAAELEGKRPEPMGVTL